MAVDVFNSVMLMTNGRDDIVYLDKIASSAEHLTRSVICALPARRILGTVAAT